MDIDRVRRALGMVATTPSRRDIGRATVGFTTGSILAPLARMMESEAKKKHKHKKKRKVKCDEDLEFFCPSPYPRGSCCLQTGLVNQDCAPVCGCCPEGQKQCCLTDKGNFCCELDGQCCDYECCHPGTHCCPRGGCCRDGDTCCFRESSQTLYCCPPGAQCMQTGIPCCSDC